MKQESIEALYLNKRAAAQLVSLSVTTLDAMRRDGRLPFHKLGRKVLFRRVDLLRLIEDARIEVAP